MNLGGFEWLKGRLDSPEGRERDVNPHVSSVILGASRKTQMEENFKALTALAKLTPEILGQVEAVVADLPPAPEVFS